MHMLFLEVEHWVEGMTLYSDSLGGLGGREGYFQTIRKVILTAEVRIS